MSSTAQHVIALLKSHIEGNDDQFFSIAIQVAAHEARQGHVKVAQELKRLVDAAKESRSAVTRRGAVPVVQPKGDLASLLSVVYSHTRLSNLVLPATLQERLERVLLEQRQQEQLRAHSLVPRRKLLLVGPPGSGKTMTAAALAGELKLPLLTIRLDGVITRFMGETASKLRLIFDAMYNTRGVYLFDEFDAIGSRRNTGNDVGEIRRVLNSFLQFLETDESHSLVVAATNHPELLDPALFRRFDDVIEYSLPSHEVAQRILRTRLRLFGTTTMSWSSVLSEAEGLSQADLARAADEAAKAAVLRGQKRVSTEDLLTALKERRTGSR
jgi:SpoVK/Ycf46/Vps4 family AAA+-type ATPase